MQKNLLMVKGDTFAFGAKFKGLEEGLDSAYFTVSQNFASPFVFQKILNNGIELIETTEEYYRYRVIVPPTDTDDVEAGVYNYSFKIEVNGAEYTLIYGTLTIVQTVPEA